MDTTQLLEFLSPISLLEVIAAGVSVLVIAAISGWLARRSRELFAMWLDELLARFFANLVRWGAIILVVAWAIQWLGLAPLLNGLLAGAGITAIVLGFAFRDIGENFLSGVILVSSRPFGSGDTIQSGEFMGNVISLDLRNTHLKTFDGKDVYLPNAMVFKNPLINFTQDGLLRLEFTIGIDYGDDIDQALALVHETVRGMEGVLSDPDPLAVVDAFASSAVNLKVFFWIDTFDYRKGRFEIRSEAMQKTKDALQSAGFGLPANIVEIKHYDRAEPVAIRIHQMNGGNTSGVRNIQ